VSQSPVEHTEKGGGVGRGAKSYDLQEAWPSINHSILSGGRYWPPPVSMLHAAFEALLKASSQKLATYTYFRENIFNFI